MKETNRTIKVSEHIRLDTRPGSAKWQARVKLTDGSWHRFSTKTESLERATEVAMKFFTHPKIVSKTICRKARASFAEWQNSHETGCKQNSAQAAVTSSTKITSLRLINISFRSSVLMTLPISMPKLWWTLASGEQSSWDARRTTVPSTRTTRH